MAPSENQPNPLVSLLPLIIIIIPIVIIVYKLAKEKGKDTTLWTILACIPIINIISIMYIVGATNSKLEAKVDKIIEALNQTDKK